METLEKYFNELRKLDEEAVQGTEGQNLDEETAEGEEAVQGTEGQNLDEETAVVKICAECGFMGTLDEDEEECPQCGSGDLSEATVKVVRDGKVITKKKTTTKRRLTSAQKAALAKARKKSHTGSAEKQRAKSNRIRSKKGMNEETAVCRCPECGYEGEMEEIEDDSED